jgi:2-C-methyl-D-erythritol 4-phosphate cytidylyltransferase
MQNKKYRTVAIILAAGIGSRMNSVVTKQQLLISGKSVLRRTLEAFESSAEVDAVVIVSRREEIEFARNEANLLNKVKSIVVGGETRAESAKKGFLAIEDDCDFVMIHDAARCLITGEKIDAVANAAYEHGAASASHPLTDSVKLVEGPYILKNIARDSVVSVQTPQAFSAELYRSAIDKASSLGSEITDDNSLVEIVGAKVFLLDTGKDNIKITDPSDLMFAEFFISRRKE